MKFKIAINHVVNLNKRFESGKLINPGSLEFALSTQEKSQNWLDHLAHLVRAVLIDHPFEDGNKRTAAALIVAYLEAYNQPYDENKISQLVVKIIKQNTIGIKKIRRLIQNVIL